MIARHALLTSTFACMVFVNGSWSGEASQTGLHPTGLLPATPEQKAWTLEHFPIAKCIRPNMVALERLNAERAAKGKPALAAHEVDLAPLGYEALLQGDTNGSSATAESLSSAVPAGVDNSQLAAFPPIGSQLGASCVGWASTYYLLTHETALARGWDAKSSASYRFSPKWTYNMINFGVDGGSYFSDCFALLTKHGAARWSEFPQDGAYRPWCLDPVVWRNAITSRIATQSSLYDANTDNLINLLKQQLANGHVLFIGTFVNSWEARSIPNDPSTSADDAYVNQYIARYMANTNAGAHAMTIVGYEDSIWCDVNLNGSVDAGEKGAFKVANSWGTGDWNAGFRWVAYDALRPVSAVSGGPTGRMAIFTSNGYPASITVSSNYTPKILAEFTVNHLKRNQLRVRLGLDDTTKTLPAYTWQAGALNLQGGAYAFDGSGTAVDGTFVFDFSDLNPPVGVLKRYFLSVYDSTSGDIATLKSFRLLSASGTVLATSANTPKTADAGQESWCWVDYGTANSAPVIQSSPWANPNPVVLPNTTTVNVLASDPDNGPSALTYTWSKLSGPGTVAFSPNGTTGSASSSASFSAAGNYVLRVTVYDGAASVVADTSVSAQANPNSKLHVAGITMSLSGNPSGTRANARVVVVNQNNAILAGASVTGTWSGVVSGSASGTTGSDGSVTLSSAKTKSSGTFTFTVTGVSLSGYTYDPAANAVSSGSITK